MKVTISAPRENVQVQQALDAGIHRSDDPCGLCTHAAWAAHDEDEGDEQYYSTSRAGSHDAIFSRSGVHSLIRPATSVSLRCAGLFLWSPHATTRHAPVKHAQRGSWGLAQ